jgi:hypothetical protein
MREDVNEGKSSLGNGVFVSEFVDGDSGEHAQAIEENGCCGEDYDRYCTFAGCAASVEEDSGRKPI